MKHGIAYEFQVARVYGITITYVFKVPVLGFRILVMYKSQMMRRSSTNYVYQVCDLCCYLNTVGNDIEVCLVPSC